MATSLENFIMVHWLDTLGVENLAKITLFQTGKEIQAILCFCIFASQNVSIHLKFGLEVASTSPIIEDQGWKWDLVKTCPIYTHTQNLKVQSKMLFKLLHIKCNFDGKRPSGLTFKRPAMALKKKAIKAKVWHGHIGDIGHIWNPNPSEFEIWPSEIGFICWRFVRAHWRYQNWKA